MRIVFIGPPGAGKGTQATRICRDRRIAHISTGKLLRDEMANGTAMGLTAKAYMDRGLLAPDRLVVNIVAKKLRERTCKRGYLLDGFPRNIAQAISLDEHLMNHRMPTIDAVIYFRVPEEVVIRRLTGRRVCQKCGMNYHLHKDRAAAEGRCERCGGELNQRRDDTLRTVLRRLQVFEEETTRLLLYYEGKGLLKEVQADQEVEDVYRSVRTAVAAGGNNSRIRGIRSKPLMRMEKFKSRRNS